MILDGGWIGDRYRVVEVLAERENRWVCRALDTTLDRSVVLEVFEGVLEPWLDEARAAAAVLHPNVATLFDVERHRNRVVLSFEDVPGPTLDELMAARPVDLGEAVELVRQIAEGLCAVHGAGWTHGDIKGANLVVRPDGVVEILDFGLASLRRSAEAGRGTRDRAGTLGSMAPEILRGEAGSPRSDLFALGVVLFRLLEGREPFSGDSAMDAARATVAGLAPEMKRKAVPLPLRNLVHGLLAPSPEDRPESAREVIRVLETVARSLGQAGSSTTHARPVGHGFRGLAPYVEADRAVFFGRDPECRALLERLREEPLLVVYGESGSGKTSFLRAGVVPLLRRRGYMAIYARPLRDPVASLVGAAEEQAAIAALEAESARAHLGRVARENEAGTVLILDQFEELFVQTEASKRESLLTLLAQLGSEPGLRMVIALRSDFLYRLAETLGAHIPDPLASRRLFLLRRLGQSQVREILGRALTLVDGAEGNLAQALADDLADREGRVLATELQIVGEQLQRRGVATADAYRRLGGREALVGAYLADVVEASSDPKGIRLVLHAFVSDDFTRSTSTLAELEARLGRPEIDAAGLVEELLAARLVREIQNREPWCYELLHEFLVPQIERLVAGQLDQEQRARRTLGRYVAEAASEPRTRIPLPELRRIRRRLRGRRTEAERALIRRSWRRGLGWAALFVALAISLLLWVAALASVRDRWIGRRLHDGHTATAHRVRFDSSGRLYSAGGDGKVIAWDFERRTALRTLESPGNILLSLAVSNEGARLATGDTRGRVEIWNTDSWQRERNTVLEGGGEIRGMAFSPDDQALAIMASGERNELRRLSDWALLGSMTRNHSRDPNFLFGGKMLFSSHTFFSVPAMDRLASDDEWALIFAVDEDRNLAISADGLGDVRFWRLHPDPRFELLSVREAHEDNCRAAVLSPDGKWAVTAAEDLILWDFENQEIEARFRYPAVAWDAVFHPSSRYVVSAHADGAVLVWDLDLRVETANLAGHSSAVRGVDFSADGRRLASASQDHSVIVWDVESGYKIAVHGGHGARVNRVRFSDDGKRFVSLTQDAELFLWTVGREEPDRRSVAGIHHEALDLSPDGRFIAASPGVFETRSGRAIFPIRTPEVDRRLLQGGGIAGARFSTDGSRLVLLGANGQFLVVDPTHWRLEQLSRHPEILPVRMDLSPDAEWVAIGQQEGHIELRPLARLERSFPLGRHEGRAREVVFSPDGRWLASAGDDHRVLLWDVESRSLRQAIDRPELRREVRAEPAQPLRQLAETRSADVVSMLIHGIPRRMPAKGPRAFRRPSSRSRPRRRWSRSRNHRRKRRSRRIRISRF